MHLLPRVGHLKLDQVTYAVIEDLKVDLAKTPLSNFKRDCKQKPKNAVTFLSQKTINNCLTVLRRMLSIARKRGLIATVPEVEWLRPPAPDFDFLDFEESQRVLDAAEGEWRTMILVALRTGLRFGELLALRWQDVDLVAGRIMVRQNWVLGQIGTPKSGHAREIPLGEEVLKALKSHRHLRGPLVFCTMAGEVFTVGEPRYWLARFCRKAGLREMGWHTLRHTFASHLAMRGAPLKAIQELLGHATIQMTMRYAHLAPEVARDAVRLLDTNDGRGKTVAKPPEIAAN
jgi:integrase